MTPTPVILIHERKVIRQYIVDALSAPSVTDPPSYPTACGANVFPNRFLPVMLNQLPLIAVYTEKEDVDLKDSTVQQDPDNPGYLLRMLPVHIQAILPVSKHTDDDLDALALQIEYVMDSHSFFETAPHGAAQIEGPEMLASTEMGYIEKGGKTLGSIDLVYRIKYRSVTRTAAPGRYAQPTTVYLGYAPEIGTPYVSDYVQVYPE